MLFIKGKLILDGPLVVNELITWSKKMKKQAFILKIYFEKAYDNVSWKFVNDSLDKMGFPYMCCSWIHGILSSARSSVLVNGAPTFEFQCGKGMRQGDPLSPFLFLIVMENLSCMLETTREAGVVHGFQTQNNGPIISHLLYTDDAVILGEWNEENIANVDRSGHIGS
ncbi:putative RNA-directed DNA polymerase [Helianthus annuus]|nr:putative RNA-directed DNA polymerase [Helianthus annuus]